MKVRTEYKNLRLMNEQHWQELRTGLTIVGRAVASVTRGPRFVSSHLQKFVLPINCLKN